MLDGGGTNYSDIGAWLEAKLELVRRIGLARFPGPRGSRIRGMLQADFGELPFYVIE